MKSSSNLKSLLKNIDRKGYPAYKSTQGTYDFGTYFLSIDHVQGDPFASPSKLSIHVKGRSAGFPASFYDTKYKQVALCDHLTRFGTSSTQIISTIVCFPYSFAAFTHPSIVNVSVTPSTVQ